jgi:hypothetical protein
LNTIISRLLLSQDVKLGEDEAMLLAVESKARVLNEISQACRLLAASGPAELQCHHCL